MLSDLFPTASATEPPASWSQMETTPRLSVASPPRQAAAGTRTGPFPQLVSLPLGSKCPRPLPLCSSPAARPSQGTDSRSMLKTEKRAPGPPTLAPHKHPAHQATYRQPPASGSELAARVLPAASLTASPSGGASSRPGRGKTRLVEGESKQEGKKKKVLRNRGPRKFVGERGWEGRWCRQQPTPSWHLDRLDSEVSLARSGNAVSRKWRKSRRKRDRRVRSKSRPDVSGRGASNAPSAFYPNSSLRGLTVCVPGGERPRRPPPGNPRSRQAGDWPVGVGF